MYRVYVWHMFISLFVMQVDKDMDIDETGNCVEVEDPVHPS